MTHFLKYIITITIDALAYKNLNISRSENFNKFQRIDVREMTACLSVC